MSIILWIVFGAIAGWIASIIMHSNTGVIGDIIVGILGALLGGFLMSLFGQGGVNGFNFYSLIVAIIGAIVLIWLYRVIRGSNKSSNA